MKYLDLESVRKLEIPLLDDPSRADTIAHTLALIYKVNEARREQERLMLALIESIVYREMVEGIPCVKQGKTLGEMFKDEPTDDYCI